MVAQIVIYKKQDGKNTKEDILLLAIWCFSIVTWHCKHNGDGLVLVSELARQEAAENVPTPHLAVKFCVQLFK